MIFWQQKSKRIIARTQTVNLIFEKTGLNQWAEQIRDCQNRPERMTVTEWCCLHGITKANYYYRLSQVRKACLETIPEEQLPQSMVPADETHPACGVDISVNGFCIHVTESTSPELLTRVLKAAAHAK